MTNSQKIGLYGEKLASNYLISKGFKILDRNYRVGRREIDIIAIHSGILVFVEVKTRKRSDYGYPEESVDDRKIELLQEAAEHYLEEKQWSGPIRFDIVSVMQQGVWRIDHFEDAF